MMDNDFLIRLYETLRYLNGELYRQAEQIDARLVEIEYLLPDDYTYPGDPPLDSLP